MRPSCFALAVAVITASLVKATPVNQIHPRGVGCSRCTSAVHPTDEDPVTYIRSRHGIGIEASTSRPNKLSALEPDCVQQGQQDHQSCSQLQAPFQIVIDAAPGEVSAASYAAKIAALTRQLSDETQAAIAKALRRISQGHALGTISIQQCEERVYTELREVYEDWIYALPPHSREELYKNSRGTMPMYIIANLRAEKEAAKALAQFGVDDTENYTLAQKHATIRYLTSSEHLLAKLSPATQKAIAEAMSAPLDQSKKFAAVEITMDEIPHYEQLSREYSEFLDMIPEVDRQVYLTEVGKGYPPYKIVMDAE